MLQGTPQTLVTFDAMYRQTLRQSYEGAERDAVSESAWLQNDRGDNTVQSNPNWSAYSDLSNPASVFFRLLPYIVSRVALTCRELLKVVRIHWHSQSRVLASELDSSSAKDARDDSHTLYSIQVCSRCSQGCTTYRCASPLFFCID